MPNPFTFSGVPGDIPTKDPELAASSIASGQSNISAWRQMAEAPYNLKRTGQDLGLAAVDAIPEWLKKKISPLIGRAVVNAVPPYSYGHHEEEVTPQKLWKAFKENKPQYQIATPENTRIAPYLYMDMARMPLWRHYWGMPEQDEGNIWLKHRNSFIANPETVGGQAVQSTIIQGIDRAKAAGRPDAYNEVSGSFIPGPRGDKWNFDLHPDEVPPATQPYDMSQIFRQLAENLSGKRNAPVVYTDY